MLGVHFLRLHDFESYYQANQPFCLQECNCEGCGSNCTSVTCSDIMDIHGQPYQCILEDAGCFNRIEPLDGKWCESWYEPSNYLGICDGTRTDCVFKGRMKCDKDSKCLGITFPYRDYESRQNAWFKEKRGVAVCKSRNLLNKSEKDWNVYQKCSGRDLSEFRYCSR